MKKNHIIEFKSRERILEKARKYIGLVELFFEENDRAIPLLLKAMKFADKDLKSEIIFLLGPFAREEVVWPLYDMLCDKSEDEDHRIRKLALKRLGEEGGDCLLELKEEIKVLIEDPNMEVKRAALEILKKHK